MTFQSAYFTIIVLTHVGFAAVFLFLHLHRRSKFLQYFALAWMIEALRVCLHVACSRGFEFSDRWFALQDLLYLCVTWLLLSACAHVVGRKPFSRSSTRAEALEIIERNARPKHNSSKIFSTSCASSRESCGSRYARSRWRKSLKPP